jgi:spermidine/putrescine transport system ATP-binding protein
MQLELKSIQMEVGLTFVHVTHDQEEAMTMADTVAVMNKGTIEQMGSPEVLYELPSTVFVANFLGQSNLFAGPVRDDGGTTISLEIGGHRLVVPKRRAQRHHGRVTAGVRPEKLSLHVSAASIPSGRNQLGPGRIIDVSFSGVSTQYLVDVPGVGTIVVFAQNMASGPVVTLGSEVWVSWDADHTFVLADDQVDDADANGLSADADAETAMIAAQTRERLLSELEEA